ncbi:MAG TPA: sugar transferase [Thermoleophilaceae bacterium]|nr:sugar transferase [Thermoleophilaceae bacterium]
MSNGLANELREIKPAEPVPPPDRDVRAGSMPILRGVLHFELLRRGARVLALAALDVGGMFLAIFTALAIKTAVVSPELAVIDRSYAQAKDYAPLACLVMLLLFARSRLYRDRPMRPGFATVISSLFQVTLVILLYAVIEGEEFSSYYIFYGTLLFALAYICSARWLFECASGAILRAAGYRHRAVLVGSGPNIDAVAHALGDSSQVEPFGYVSLDGSRSDGLRDFGSLERLERHFDAIDEVLITDSDFAQEKAVDLVDRCHGSGIRVRVAPSTMEILMDRVEFVPGQSLPLFELKPPLLDGVDFVVKRVFDVAGSLFLLTLFSPPMAMMALAIKLDSRGRVLFRSKRPGIGGAPFKCLKFRTMHQGAEALQEQLEEHNEMGGAIFKIRRDPRVTPVGAFLRRWSLDELPQLFNVLRGDMSLVGPRPLPERDYERLEEWHRKRYLVLPGLTGLWQVSGRSELDFDELVRLDFLYLERWSVFLDLTILLKTLPAVFRSRGAW